MAKAFFIMTALCALFAAAPCAAEVSSYGDEIVLCRLEPAAINRFVTPSVIADILSPANPLQAEKSRPTPRLRLEANDTLAALNFINSGSISPYIGAGIGQEESPIPDPSQPDPLSVRLGAGFGCTLDTLTHLFFNYSFQFTPDPYILNEQDETHHLSLGLQVTF